MKPNPVLIIAKKEILDNIRNKWVILLSIVFSSLALVASYFGSIFSTGWQDFGGTISSMMSLVQFLIPIIALILGYSAIIGEIERGSMSSLISMPLNRIEIVLGKFIGLGSIIALTTIIGFGMAGIIIAVNVPGANFADYLVFIGATILIGLVFISLAIFFSSLFKKRSTAMGGAVFLWFFFNMILPMVFVGILIANIGLQNFSSDSIPDWYFAIQLINPISVYGNLVSLNVGPVSSLQDSFSMSYPDFYSSGLMIFILILWILLFIFLSYRRFNKRDV